MSANKALWGKIAIVGIVVSALAAGALLYYTQVYAFYVRLENPAPIVIVSEISGQQEPIVTTNLQAIDADSSPIRFRACFDTPLSMGTMTDTFRFYDDAEPLNAPGWFGCFDAAAIAAELNSGDALAFEGASNMPYGFDTVVVVNQSGQGFVWRQLNACGDAVYSGDPAPAGCPPAPDGIN